MACVLSWAALSARAGAVGAQDPSSRASPAGPPPVFAALEGVWEGTGTLLGRPAVFDMAWEVVDDDFVRLAFSNAFVDEAGAETPVLSARGVYHPRGSSAVGVWVDDRPQRITIEAVVTDSSVVSEWTGETEAGRTEYLVRSPDEIIVRDFVMVDGSARPFGEATYRRARKH